MNRLLAITLSALVAVTTVTVVSAASDWRSKVDDSVLTAAQSGATEFIVYMAAHADLRPAAQISTKAAKGAFVYEALTTVARESQAPVVALLDSLGSPSRSFWIANTIVTSGGLNVIEAVALRPDVRAVYAIGKGELHRPVAASAPEESNATNAVAVVGPSIDFTNANDAWDLGYRGQGVVVAGADTGVRWTHSALKGHYRGWNAATGTANHNYNWHNAAGPNAACPTEVADVQPCDDHDHGTHTVGTMVGDDGGANQIGMAPDAEWIACRNMTQGFGAVPTYMDCMQWFIAPTDLAGNNPDPAKAPDVVNNSWGCVEVCAPPILKDMIDASRAAGIFYAVSAGNDNQFFFGLTMACNTINFPLAVYSAAFTVGALDASANGTPSDNVADYSSLGPVADNPAEGVNYRKPDIAAPGTNVRSSVSSSDTAYGAMSGTSMAGPHVAGLVALIISANPELRGHVETIEDIIESTAKPLTSDLGCGGDSSTQVPNNVFGHGRINALAAVQKALVTDPDPNSTPTPTGVPSATPTTDPGACQTTNWSDDLEPSADGEWRTGTDQNALAPLSPTWSQQVDIGAHSATHSWSNDARTLDLKDSHLIAPPQRIGANTRLSFWHRFYMESGYDGGVLEVSTNGGLTWRDVTDAGSFVAGGYNDTISTEYGSPISGRDAWSGGEASARVNTMTRVEVTLGGFVPAGKSSVTALVRWRYAADELGGTPGDEWWIDDIAFNDVVVSCPSTVPTPTPSMTPSVTPTPTVAPTPTPSPTIDPSADHVYFLGVVNDGNEPGEPREDFQADMGNLEFYLAKLRETYSIPASQATILAFTDGWQDAGGNPLSPYAEASEANVKAEIARLGALASQHSDSIFFFFLSSHGIVYGAGGTTQLGSECPPTRLTGSLSGLKSGGGETGDFYDCELGAALGAAFAPTTRMFIDVDCSFCGGFSESLTATSGTIPDNGASTPAGIVGPNRIVVTGCAMTTECFGDGDSARGGVSFGHMRDVLEGDHSCDGWTAPGFPAVQGFDIPTQTAPLDGRCTASEWFFAAVDSALNSGDPIAVQQQFRIKYGFATLAQDLLIVGSGPTPTPTPQPSAAPHEHDELDPAHNVPLPCEAVSGPGAVTRSAVNIVHVANVCGFVGTDIEFQSRTDANGVVHDYAFVGTMGAGTRIYDVTDPRLPRFVGGYTDPGWQNDVQVFGDTLILAFDPVAGAAVHASDCLRQKNATLGQTRGGVDLVHLHFDPSLASLKAPLTFRTERMGCYLTDQGGGAHTITIHPSGQWLSLNTSSSGIEVVDLRNNAFTFVRKIPSAVAASAHDVFFSRDGNTMYIAGVGSTRIVDVSDIFNRVPTLIATITNVPPADQADGHVVAISHQSDVTADGRLMVITDEKGGGLSNTACNTSAGGVIGGANFYALAPLAENPAKSNGASPSSPRKVGTWLYPRPELGVDPLDDVLAGLGRPEPSCTIHVYRLGGAGGQSPAATGQGNDGNDGVSRLPINELVSAHYGAGVWHIDVTAAPGAYDDSRTTWGRTLGWNVMPGADTWSAKEYKGFIYAGDMARGFDVYTFAQCAGATCVDVLTSPPVPIPSPAPADATVTFPYGRPGEI